MAKFGVCGFCGRRDQVLDREHYIAQRFKKYFPKKDLDEYTTLFFDWDPQMGAPVVRENRHLRSAWADPIGGIGHDCCNGGWMKDLDAHVEPILANAVGTEPLKLTIGDQRALSRWACKVVALCEMHLASTGRAMTHQDRMWIKNRGSPPRGTRVWMGAYDWGGIMHPRSNTTSISIELEDPTVASDSGFHPVNTYVASITFANLLLVLYGTKTSVDIATPDDRVADRVIGIWPCFAGTVWPKLPLLSGSELIDVEHGIAKTFNAVRMINALRATGALPKPPRA
jgi:hypothetical protein